MTVALKVTLGIMLRKQRMSPPQFQNVKSKTEWLTSSNIHFAIALVFRNLEWTDPYTKTLIDFPVFEDDEAVCVFRPEAEPIGFHRL